MGAIMANNFHCERCYKALPIERERRYHPGFDLSSIPGFDGITAASIREYTCICRKCETILNEDISRIMQHARFQRDERASAHGTA